MLYQEDENYRSTLYIRGWFQANKKRILRNVFTALTRE